MLFPLNFSRFISWARVLLAAAALVVSYLSIPLSVPFYALLGLYFAYSVVVALRGKVQSGMLGLLALFGDTVYFLIIASYGNDRLIWNWRPSFSCSCWRKR